MTLDEDKTIAFDVDGTLIKPVSGLGGDVSITNPYSKNTQRYKILKANVELLAQSLGRGRQVIVWSAAGKRWAMAVLDSLGFDVEMEHIIVMTKPITYVDDLPWDSFCPRVFVKDPGDEQ